MQTDSGGPAVGSESLSLVLNRRMGGRTHLIAISTPIPSIFSPVLAPGISSSKSTSVVVAPASSGTARRRRARSSGSLTVKQRQSG